MNDSNDSNDSDSAAVLRMNAVAQECAPKIKQLVAQALALLPGIGHPPALAALLEDIDAEVEIAANDIDLLAEPAYRSERVGCGPFGCAGLALLH